MKRKIIMYLLVGLIMAQAASALAVNDTDVTTVSVTISEVTWVNIDPNALSYTGLQPGADGTDSDEASNFYAVQMENIGSHNITHMWYNVTQPTARPFGLGLASAFNAGNFVVLRNESGGNYFFVDRVEYNETRGLVYITDVNGNIPYDMTKFHVGRFRNASHEYFWMTNISLAAGGQKWCNTSGAVIWIGNVSHQKTSQGTIDFSGGLSNAGMVRVSLTNAGAGATNWGVGQLGAGTNSLAGYCVAVKSTCTEVRFYKTNMEAPGATSVCTANAYYTVGETGDANPRYNTAPLKPGQSVVMWVRVRIPYGVYEGTVTQGTLMVLVNDA